MWLDCGVLEAKLKRNCSKMEATLPHEGIAPTTPQKPPSRPLQLPTILGPIFSLKACIPLSCSSTFDRFVKELSEFRGRSLVHRDPPAFRLNSEGIGAGLITNSSLILSNFPLEF